MGAQFKVDVDDNTKEMIKKLGSEMATIMRAAGTKAEGYAKEQCPVDTGRLRNSITHQEDGGTMVVGSNVEYAASVEFSEKPHRNGKSHFLRDSIQDHLDEYKEIIENGVKAALS